MLEQQRLLNQTFDGEKKDYTECNRPGFRVADKDFILVLLACIQ